MNEEIKEILYYLKDEDEYYDGKEKVVLSSDEKVIERDDISLLLNYITNLQQENKAKTHQIEVLEEIVNYERNIRNDKLQRENEKLKEEVINVRNFIKLRNVNTETEDKSILYNLQLENINKIMYLDYKSRCEKAIEYIMTDLITEWDIKNDGYVSGSDLPADSITPILNILNGSDENE